MRGLILLALDESPIDVPLAPGLADDGRAVLAMAQSMPIPMLAGFNIPRRPALAM